VTAFLRYEKYIVQELLLETDSNEAVSYDSDKDRTLTEDMMKTLLL